MATLHKTALVVDNHQLIDPVKAKYPRSNPDYNMHRKVYRQAALEKYVYDSSHSSQLIVFTGQLFRLSP